MTVAGPIHTAPRHLPLTQFQQRPLTQAPPASISQPIESPPPQGNTRSQGDLELSKHYGITLAKSLDDHALDGQVSPIPANSTFGQWWAQLRRAFQAPDITQWMNERGIDPDSVEINPGTGQVMFRLKRLLDPRQVIHTVGQDDAQWAAASRHLMMAARVIAAGSYFATFKPPQAKTSNIAPMALIGHFYRERNVSPLPTPQERVADFAVGKGFPVINDPAFAELRAQRDEDTLAQQKALLGNVHTRRNVAETLKTLLAGLQSGTAEISTYLTDYHASVHPDSDSEYAGTTPSLRQVFASNGWDIPTDHAQLENIVKALITPPPVRPEHDNYAGALDWPLPADNLTRLELMADLRQGAFGDIDISPFANVLEYLLDKAVITPEALSNPRQLLDRLINSPKGRALGQAIQARFNNRSVSGSANDWLLAAMSADPQHAQQGDKRNIAGFLLTDARNGAYTASEIVLTLTDHLLDTGRSSSYEKAQLLAHLLLSSQAPELLVKGIPDAVKFGTHSWVSFATAVSRIEASAPGATAAMTYAQVMLAADIAPISLEQRQVEYQAQQQALKDWAVVNGMEFPASDESMLTVRQAFDQHISELSAASAAHSRVMPDVKQKGLQELAKAFPDMAPGLFEKKCIELKRQHLDFPGPYSLLDLYMHDGAQGTPGFYDGITRDTADSANQWISTSTDVDLDTILPVLIDLPHLKNDFRVAFPLYADGINKSVATQVKQLVSTQSLEHRRNFEFGKITLAKQVITEHDHFSRSVVKSRTTVSEGHSLLVRTEREGKVNIYEIDIKQNKILHRDDLGDFDVSQQEGSVTYREVVPSGTYDSGIADETKGASGIPNSFSSDRTSYIAAAMMKEVNIEGLKAAALGLTTFDTEVPFYKTATEFMLNLIPLRSAIKNFSEGNYGVGIIDLTMDAFGFMLGLGAAAKGAKALQLGASVASKIARGTKIVGRAAISTLNPLDGLGNLAVRSAKAGASGSVYSYRWLRGSIDSYDLLKASKRFDASAIGTFKLQGTVVEGPAVLNGGKWHAFDTASGQAFGKSLDDFVPSARLETNRLGGWETTRSVGKLDDNVVNTWKKAVRKHREGNERDAFENGYSSGTLASVPGLSKSSKIADLIKLGGNQNLTALQAGVLMRRYDDLAYAFGHRGVARFIDNIEPRFGSVTPMPQVVYFSQTSQLSEGQCAALARTFASAMAEGKDHLLIKNMYTAAAFPTDPASRRFMESLRKLQVQVGGETAFHAGKVPRLETYQEMVKGLADSAVSKSVMIDSPGHAMAAGVKIEGDVKSFYFYDPNHGVATFSSAADMEGGLKKLFHDKKMNVQYKTHANDSNTLKFKVFDHDDEWQQKNSVFGPEFKKLYEAQIIPSAAPRPLSHQQLKMNWEKLHADPDNHALNCYQASLRVGQAEKTLSPKVFDAVTDATNGSDGINYSTRYLELMEVKPGNLKDTFNPVEITESGFLNFKHSTPNGQFGHTVYVQKTSSNELMLFNTNNLDLDAAMVRNGNPPQLSGAMTVYNLGNGKHKGLQNFIDGFNGNAGWQFAFTPASVLNANVNKLKPSTL